MVTGAAAEARASAKVAYYESACQARSWSYTAFVAETTGAVNQAGQRLVRKLIRQEAYRGGWGPQGWAATAGSGLVRVRPHVKHAYSAGERPKAPVPKEP